MPKRTRSVAAETARLIKQEAKQRRHETLVRFVAECVARGFRPFDFIPLVEVELKERWTPAQARNFKHRYVTDAEVDAARERIERGEVTWREPGSDGGTEPPNTESYERYLALARDPDAVLGRIAYVFFTTSDPKTITSAGKIVAAIAGHNTKAGSNPRDTEAMDERAEALIQRAMAERKCDRETAITEICRRAPEFQRVAQRLRAKGEPR